jgi:type I restriction enzyme, S subunit
MTGALPVVSLGEVARHRKEFIKIDDASAYRRCRVQLHARGVVERDTVPGLTIKTKEQQVCRAGELLVAEIDAKVGGFGIVPQDLNGAIVSSHYFLFTVDGSRLDPRFLDFFVRTRTFRDQVSAQGSTNYAAIRPQHVLGYKIPLPPVATQRRIVARVQDLAGRVQRASVLRTDATMRTGAFLQSQMAAFRRSFLADHHRVEQLGDVTTITSGGTPSRVISAFWGGDVPWVKTAELKDGDINGSEERITSQGLDASSAKLFPPDTVLIALYGQGQTRGRTGRLLIEAATNQACCAILPTPDLDPRYLQWWLRSLYTEMRRETRAGAQPNWNAQHIKRVRIAIPALSDQCRAVAYFDGIQAKVDILTTLQEKAGAELDALMPSILDKAFRGDL